MNREMRRKSAVSLSRDEKIAVERGKQSAARENKVLHTQVIPYWNKKREEFVPKACIKFANFLIRITNPIRKFVGHTPPLFFAQLISAMTQKLIFPPIVRTIAFAIISLTSFIGIPFSMFAVLVDLLVLAPVDFIRKKASMFGLSFRIEKTNEYAMTTVLTILKWGKVVDVKHFDL